MKKLLLISLLLLAGLEPVSAQDYAPFRVGQTPYFQAGDSIYSLRITNAYVLGTDSVFEFNPRIVPTEPNLYLAAQTENNLFGFQMLKSSTGHYRFLFAYSDEFLLKPRAAVGETWPFSVQLQLTATLHSKTAGMVLGQPDSIVTILISNGDTIRTSKKYGLLSARSFTSYVNPAASAQVLRLLRLPQAGMGTALHHPFTIFDFQPGDKFLREGIVRIGMPPCYKYFETTEILSRNQNADSIWYQIRKQTLKIGVPGWPCVIPNGAVLLPFDTILFVVRPAEQALLFSLSNEPSTPPFVGFGAQYHNLGQFVSTYHNRLGTHFEVLYLTDSLAGTYQGVPDGQGHRRYAEGLGQTRYYQDQGGEEELIAYIKGTETYGNWAQLTSLEKELPQRQPLQVFPNPFSSEITFQLPESTAEPAEITVFNLQGQRVHQQAVVDLPAQTGLKVQLPILPTGLYLLQVRQAGKTYSAKIQRR